MSAIATSLYKTALRSKLYQHRGGYRVQQVLSALVPKLVPIDIFGLPPIYIDPRLAGWQSQELLLGTPYSTSPHEPHIQRVARTLIRPTDTVVDVGANLGLHTALFASLVPRGEVIACEPNPLLIPGLSETVKNLTNVRLYECALGDKPCEVTLSVGTDHSQGSLAQDVPSTASFTCVMKMLPMLTGRADFIKIDVEGAELMVLRGSKMLLEKEDAPFIVFEEVEKTAKAFGQPITAAKDYLASLKKPGYTFWTLHREGRVEPYALPRPVWSDVLAAPASRSFDPSLINRQLRPISL